MSLFDALAALLNGKVIGHTWTLPTFYTNMKNKDLLIRTQDSIWDSGKFMPTVEAGAEVTHCNQAVEAVLDAFGYTKFDTETADDMMAALRASKDFERRPMNDGQFLANQGSVVIAGLDSKQLGQSHGHVCTLTPGKAEWSGHWGEPAPACLSIGRKAICFRTKGVNWAFVPEPELYVWKDTL